MRYIPVLIVRAHLRGDVGIGEDGQLATGFGYNSCALDVLIAAKTDVDRGVSYDLEQLCARMFVQHALAECPKLLPFITAVLRTKISRMPCA